MGAQAVRLSNVDIDNALKNKDFEVLFQPVFDLGNGALARVESFVRWRHPKLGLLPPGAFISFFESQGRMSELTRYVLANALTTYTDWRGPYAPGLSINLALSDLSDDAFTSHFTKLLRDLEFPADLVTLECPMPPVDMPVDKAAEHFKRLGDTGARLAIEVRGRANDLLRSLDPFPFDEIKTGGSAILRFARTVRGPGLSAIADLLDVANKANAAITAVGVEDQASLSALRGLGFTAAQGNHLGKVGSLSDFRPNRINEVRSLLELDPLSAENLAALFRTEAPALQPTQGEAQQSGSGDAEDALINRLNKRVAQFNPQAEKAEAKAETATPNQTNNPPSEPAKETQATPEAVLAPKTDEESEKKARAREKAKALVLAKRAKARAARKNAAIERAKARAGLKPDAETQDQTNEPAQDDPAATQLSPPPTAKTGQSAPRKLQERLNQEFNADESASDNAAHAATTGADTNSGEPETSPIYVSQEELSQTPPAIAVRTPDVRAQQKMVASLQVGLVGAYLQQGIRVGSPALMDQPDAPVEPSKLALPTPAAAPARPSNGRTSQPDAAPADTAEIARAETLATSMPAPKSIDENPAPAEADQPTPEDREMIGDLHAEDNGRAPLQPRAPKNFLTRKHRILPTHFWPKSWKRVMRRRAAAKAAQRREEHEAAKEKLAAE